MNKDELWWLRAISKRALQSASRSSNSITVAGEEVLLAAKYLEGEPAV
jgi:hypothetical protein